MAEGTETTAKKAMVLLARGREAWAAMPTARRTRLLAALLFLASVAAGVAWWSSRTDWRVLYAGLEPRDAAQVESELAAASVTYRATQNGATVEVPAELVDKARMEVATKGMPGSGRMGFELFDKPNWVGSDFEEKVNYQRALEGELEHTIASVEAVRSARVHLVLPKDSLFTSEAQPAKASVTLKLKGQGLSREGADSLRNLVAGAVEGLSAQNVTLIDADGRSKLNSPGRDEQMSAEEAQLEGKLVSVLEPLTGRDSVRATVTLRYDTGAEERTDEIVDPKDVVAVSTQRSEQVQNGATRTAQGVPGTSSNAPNASAPNSVANAAAAGSAAGNQAVAASNGTAPAPDALLNTGAASSRATSTSGNGSLPVYPGAGGQGASLHEENNSYAVSRHTIHQEQGPGRLLRLTAAILVNDRAVVEGTGKNQHTVWKPRSPEELKRLQELAQAAVGFDPGRGDSLVVEDIAFTTNEPDATAPTRVARLADGANRILRTQPELLRWAGGGVLALLLLFMVVRPVTKSAVALLSEPARLTTSEEPFERVHLLPEAMPSESAGAVEAAELPEVMRRPPALENRGLLEQVTSQIKREPNESTRLLESWLREPAQGRRS